MGNEMGNYAKQIAKASALIHRTDHSYLPQTAEEFLHWEPHAWVVDAIKVAARDQGKPSRDVIARLRRVLLESEKGTVNGITASDEEAINLAIEYMEARL